MFSYSISCLIWHLSNCGSLCQVQQWTIVVTALTRLGLTRLGGIIIIIAIVIHPIPWLATLSSALSRLWCLRRLRWFRTFGWFTEYRSDLRGGNWIVRITSGTFSWTFSCRYLSTYRCGWRCYCWRIGRRHRWRDTWGKSGWNSWWNCWFFTRRETAEQNNKQVQTLNGENDRENERTRTLSW